MRRKQNLLPFLLIFIVIFAIISIPKFFKEKISGGAVSTFVPFWEKILNLKNFSFMSKSTNSTTNSSILSSESFQKLELENQQLQQEIATYKELLEHELNLIVQLSSFIGQHSSGLSNEIRQHKEEICNLIKMQLKAIPAHIIFRPYSSWNSSLWINVGHHDNQKLSDPIIQKNSPVVVGKSVIGVIDYVGKNQSRVKLITDSGLCPSVRVLRGGGHNKFLRENIQCLAGMIAINPELFDDSNEKTIFLKNLESIKNKLLLNQKSWLLAKGELQGRSNPFWRSLGQTLKGIGFNYDYADGEGPARDLRSGIPLNASGSIPAMPIIQENDLLITTGLDGVFPPGLAVAEVTKIQLLREGDYYYELEATPTAGNLDELFIVHVLPPLTFSLTEAKIDNLYD